MNKRFFGRALGALALVGLLAVGVMAQSNKPQYQTLKVEVSEDMSRFVFDKDVAFEDGMPKHGSSFITQGYIYPAGTLKGGEDGVNKDGSPKYPDKVIGEWTCRGFFIGEAMHAKSGPIVITTQVYSFGKAAGNKTIVTDGYELMDVGKPVSRAITGGTGEYVGVEGELKQTLLGLNASEGVNLRLEFKLRK